MSWKIVIVVESLAVSVLLGGFTAVITNQPLTSRSQQPSVQSPADKQFPLSHCSRLSLDELADQQFHINHPELGGRKIRTGEETLAQEWWAIRASVKPCSQ